MFACKHVKPHCQDCTCEYTFTSTHVNDSAVRDVLAANTTETFKPTKYRTLTDRYQFEEVAFETAGTYRDGTKTLFAMLVVG